MYESGRLWLNKKHITGRIRAYIPYVGVLTILLNDYPMFKWGLLSFMAIMVLTSKDPNDTWIILNKWYHNIIKDKILIFEGINLIKWYSYL